MKRTIALVLSLIFMLVLVPTTALAENDVGAYLVVEAPYGRAHPEDLFPVWNHRCSI